MPGRNILGRVPLGPALTRRGAKLGVVWETRGENFRASLLALLHGPAPPQGWPVGPFFRDSWLRLRPPWKMLTASALLHVLAAVFPIWTWVNPEVPAPPAPHEYAITWSGPMRDLLPYFPRGPRAKTRMPGHRARHNTPPKYGADAYHPRQTIISAPALVTHPRQTLIQPDAPPEPPKILPEMPNVAQWTPAPPPRPVRRHLRVNTSARVRTRQPAPKPLEAMPAPDVMKTPALLAEFTLATAAPNIAKPKLEVQRTARPQFRAPEAAQQTTSAPDVAPNLPADMGTQRLVALSAMPAPPPPKLEVPAGNLGARFAISPEGKQPGVPGGSSTGADLGASDGGSGPGAGSGAMGGGGKGAAIPGISIAGGSLENSGTISGTGSGLTPTLRARPKLLPLEPTPRAEAVGAAPARTDSLLDRVKAGLPPENILEPGRIYTLHVNMPNLASATGSWVLKFTELEEEERKAQELGAALDLAGPVPLHKVDPKYPPALVSAKIQGEVVLYAIIRRDGSVDSIQLIQGLDPQLDQNAMEALARWKFRAAERKGKPVELETIVRIPFHIVSSIY